MTEDLQSWTFFGHEIKYSSRLQTYVGRVWFSDSHTGEDPNEELYIYHPVRENVRDWAEEVQLIYPHPSWRKVAYV